MGGQITVLSGGSLSLWDQIANWYRDSVLCELLTYLEERYFHVQFGAYEHISLGASASSMVQTIILALVFGIILASVVTAYTRTKYGDFVRKLIHCGCLSEETAKTLKELEEFQNSSIRRALLRSPTLQKYVVRVLPPSNVQMDLSRSEAEELFKQEQNPGMLERIRKRKKEAAEFSVARFYLPEELKAQAEERFERKGSGWSVVLITIAATLVGAALLCRFLPDFVQLLDNLIGMTAPQT